MTKYPRNIIIMKVGPHSDMSLVEIVKSKQKEELLHGVQYWGYSGVFCQPKPTKYFCKKCVDESKIPPSLVLLETKSPYKSQVVGMIKEYSEDDVSYRKFKKPVQLQGAEFSFVARNLRVIKNFPLNSYSVVGGKNDGKKLLEHLRLRINKSFATLRANEPVHKTSAQTATVLIADLVEPFAVWLKD